MTQTQGKQLLILAAQADYLGALRERKRISDEEYFARLNDIRRQVGLEPLQRRPETQPRKISSPAWAS